MAFLLNFLLLILSCHGRTHNKLPLTHYFVFGDKFSGVKFLSNVLNQTSPSLPLQECKALNLTTHGSTYKDKESAATSWRYGFLSANDIKKKLDCNLDQTLFIMIVKDVRSMICSVAKRKFNIPSRKLIEMHLNALIVHRWEDNDHLDLNGKEAHHSSKTSPTRSYNYLKLRSQKLANHYRTLSRLKNGVVVRYEDLLQDPTSELKNILRGRGLVVGSSINVVTNIVDNNRVNDTKQLCHPRFTPKMHSKINYKLNKRMEKKVGYSLEGGGGAKHPNTQSSTIWTFFLGLMWWIIVPTLTIVTIILIPIAFKEISSLFVSTTMSRNDQGTETIKNNTTYRTKTFSGTITKPQWVEVMERSTGRLYYVNRETGRVQWNRPSHFERYKGMNPIFNNSAEYFARQSKLD